MAAGTSLEPGTGDGGDDVPADVPGVPVALVGEGPVGPAVGRDVAVGAGAVVACGVAEALGLGVAAGEGFAVAAGVAAGVGVEGGAVGSGVGVEGGAVGGGVGGAVGAGVGCGVGGAVAGTMIVTVPPSSESSNRSRLIASKVTACVPADSVPLHVNQTCCFQSVPLLWVMACESPPTLTRTQSAGEPSRFR